MAQSTRANLLGDFLPANAATEIAGWNAAAISFLIHRMSDECSLPPSSLLSPASIPGPALIMGALLALGFTIIGLKFGLIIGLVLGVLNIVPYLGTITGLGVALPL